MAAATCHLSSLKINAGDEIIILPISYSALKETSEMVYGTGSQCIIAGMPLFGTYRDFGMVDLNESSESNCDRLREQ